MVTESEILLGVNIDHVATLRQARGTRYPDPVQAAITAEQAGADSVTLHLREDRRHIHERDVDMLRDILQTSMNLEMAVTGEMLTIAERVRPQDCCLVPERREELTTEGGLDTVALRDRLAEALPGLRSAGIEISLFVDPDPDAIEAAAQVEADFVELHTGAYANARGEERENELKRLETAAIYAHSLGLRVNAGHGVVPTGPDNPRFGVAIVLYLISIFLALAIWIFTT